MSTPPTLLKAVWHLLPDWLKAFGVLGSSFGGPFQSYLKFLLQTDPMVLLHATEMLSTFTKR